MANFVRTRSPSLLMVVLMLLLIVMLQTGISFSLTFGGLGARIPIFDYAAVSSAWLALRLLLVGLAAALWLLNRKRALFRLIIVTTAALTVGLFLNMTALVDALAGASSHAARLLLRDVVFMAASNILIFSIWYWVIDPPGVDETQRDEAAWDFLFPQRAASMPHYETWLPRYTDYLYVAFTTSFAFSPTDTMPLTRRAKLLMLLQAVISIITLTVIAGAAINILASSS